MNDQLNIPKKVRVGFQNRKDTYTGKLAFVTWIDAKGKLRQERSWEGWRDKKIDALEIDNERMEGFVLNKGVGGARHSYGWNARNEYIRVYDPRGFEFEISVANLLFILQECSAIKGKGLEGEFVFAWSGPKVVLLPVDSQEYKSSTEFTTLQTKKVTQKEMVPGCTYITKKEEELVYIGRFDWHESNGRYYSDYEYEVSKKHIFIYVDKLGQNKNRRERYYLDKGFTKLAERLTDTPLSNFAEIFEGFSTSKFASMPVEFVVKSIIFKIPDKKRGSYWNTGPYDTGSWLAQGDNSYVQCSYRVYEEGRSNRYSYYRQEKSDAELRYDIVARRITAIQGDKFTMKNCNTTIKSSLTKQQVANLPFVDLAVKFSNGERLSLKGY